MGIFSLLFGNTQHQPSRTKVEWDFYLSKASALSLMERYLKYWERKFYCDDDWPNIYRLGDSYKDVVLSPVKELLSMKESSLFFVHYADDSFYLGQKDSDGKKHGLGLYFWAMERDAESDIHREMFVGYWNHGQQTSNGSQIDYSSDECKIWFKACSEGFCLSPLNGLSR